MVATRGQPNYELAELGALMLVGPEPAIGDSVRWRGAGAGAEGAAVELAAVSVVEAPALGGGASVG